eukprot:scaffold1971_cov356-Pinguiococcus_pyrenoidosus.AAC.1
MGCCVLSSAPLRLRGDRFARRMARPSTALAARRSRRSHSAGIPSSPAPDEAQGRQLPSGRGYPVAFREASKSHLQRPPQVHDVVLPVAEDEQWHVNASGKPARGGAMLDVPKRLKEVQKRSRWVSAGPEVSISRNAQQVGRYIDVGL